MSGGYPDRHFAELVEMTAQEHRDRSAHIVAHSTAGMNSDRLLAAVMHTNLAISKQLDQIIDILNRSAGGDQ